jgi:drug/metabolite transporter (DMT)-like permease
MFILYFLFACAGMVFIKMGGQPTHSTLFTLPVLNLGISIMSLVGFAFYALSFILYASLLGKYELSFLNPMTIGVTSILIFVSAIVFFGEVITFGKAIGLALILLGVFIINLVK